MFQKIWNWIKENYKKVVAGLALVLGGAGAVVVSRSIAERYKSVKEQSKLVGAELQNASKQLSELTAIQQSDAERVRELQESLQFQSAVIDRVASQCREDENILRESEQQLQQAQSLIQFSRAILEKYKQGVENK